jgi:hypothetical protein
MEWPGHLDGFDVYLLDRWPARSARVHHPAELRGSPLLWFHDGRDQGRPCVGGRR